MVKVSIIVPVYNTSKYLKRCLDSLINQSLCDIEIILINDGSTDSSDAIIKEYNDSRIKYFKRKNHGIGATRNFGIDKASGEFIAFVDSDDYVCDDMFLKMYNHSIENNLDIVICDHYIDRNSLISQQKFISFDVTDLNHRPSLLMDVNLAPWNKLYRRSLFDSKSYFPIDLKYEDTPFVAYMFSRASRIGKLDECLYYYVVHSNSQTTVIDDRVFDIFKITDIILEQFDNSLVKSSAFDLVIYLITKYTISQRYVKKRCDRNNFIDQAFIYLKRNIPNYKKSTYFKKRNVLKRTIEKSRFLTIFYCDIYALFRKWRDFIEIIATILL